MKDLNSVVLVDGLNLHIAFAVWDAGSNRVGRTTWPIYSMVLVSKLNFLIFCGLRLHSLEVTRLFQRVRYVVFVSC